MRTPARLFLVGCVPSGRALALRGWRRGRSRYRIGYLAPAADGHYREASLGRGMACYFPILTFQFAVIVAFAAMLAVALVKAFTFRSAARGVPIGCQPETIAWSSADMLTDCISHRRERGIHSGAAEWSESAHPHRDPQLPPVPSFRPTGPRAQIDPDHFDF